VPLEILTAAIAASEGAQGSLITYMEGHFKADLQILGYIADAVEDGNLQVPFKYATEGGRERYVAELRDEIAGLQQTWDASKAEGDVISLMVIAAATKLERRYVRQEVGLADSDEALPPPKLPPLPQLPATKRAAQGGNGVSPFLWLAAAVGVAILLDD